ETQTLHLNQYPVYQKERNTDVSKMGIALDILKRVRGLRTDYKIGNGAKLEKVILDTEISPELYGVIKSGARADSIELGNTFNIVVKQND
ncbi:MAG: hypothetical protein GX944_01315, partial [Alphaproteobacteria bacterium]|nr:hypothetical protein [Alphaproteobacteria bacterium]